MKRNKCKTALVAQERERILLHVQAHFHKQPRLHNQGAAWINLSLINKDVTGVS